MGNNFQNHNLRRRFERQNPGTGSDLVDFSITSKDEEYSENLETLRLENPQYDWGESEDYDDYARSYLREQASEMGLKITTLREHPHHETSLEHFMYQVAEDVTQTLILLLSEKGHGKSSSLKTIVQHIKQTHPEITFKVFDPSTSWYRSAPLKHRQRVTIEAIENRQALNIADMVHEIGDLHPDLRRAYIATIIREDFKTNRENTINGEQVNQIVYVIEESETTFNSYSLRKNDAYTPILRDFIAIGRNFSMSAFLVATRSIGELSPALRDRSRNIYGRITSPSDLAEAKRRDKDLEKQVRTQKRYTFTYEGKTTKIPDLVKNTPQDFNQTPKPIINHPTHSTTTPLWIKLLIGIILGVTVALL